LRERSAQTDVAVLSSENSVLALELGWQTVKTADAAYGVR
jgi:hypothetical protein